MWSPTLPRSSNQDSFWITRTESERRGVWEIDIKLIWRCRWRLGNCPGTLMHYRKCQEHTVSRASKMWCTECRFQTLLLLCDSCMELVNGHSPGMEMLRSTFLVWLPDILNLQCQACTVRSHFLKMSKLPSECPLERHGSIAALMGFLCAISCLMYVMVQNPFQISYQTVSSPMTTQNSINIARTGHCLYLEFSPCF